MALTVLCTGLAEAVRKDEAPEVGGFDLSAGMFGPHVSDWLRSMAAEVPGAVELTAAPDTSLRDRFAGLAMQALIATPIEEWPETYSSRSVSAAAYEQADAMLAARGAPT